MILGLGRFGSRDLQLTTFNLSFRNKWGFPGIRGTILWVHSFFVCMLGPPILGNYHIHGSLQFRPYGSTMALPAFGNLYACFVNRPIAIA